MNTEAVVAALGLPPGACLNWRFPRNLLLEQAAPTAADRRLIETGVEELRWLAALKPATASAPEYRDQACEYLEVAVLRLTPRPGARSRRLTELVHRAVPYPVLLLTDAEGVCTLSVAHKRRSQGEADKFVLDGEVVSAVAEDSEHAEPFLAALALSRQPRTHLRALYQGWVEVLLALRASAVTGRFALQAAAGDAAERATGLAEYTRLEARLASLCAAATRETQVARQVELNLEVQRLRQALTALRSRL